MYAHHIRPKNSVVKRSIKAVVKKIKSRKGDEITILKWNDDYYPIQKPGGTSDDFDRNTGFESRGQSSGPAGLRGGGNSSPSSGGFPGGLR